MGSIDDLLRDKFAQARKLDAAATPLPWQQRVSDGCAANRPWIDAGERGYEVLTPANVDCTTYCYGGSSRAEMRKEDMALLLHARNHYAALWAVAEAAAAFLNITAQPVPDRSVDVADLAQGAVAFDRLEAAMARLAEVQS